MQESQVPSLVKELDPTCYNYRSSTRILCAPAKPQLSQINKYLFKYWVKSITQYFHFKVKGHNIDKASILQTIKSLNSNNLKSLNIQSYFFSLRKKFTSRVLHPPENISVIILFFKGWYFKKKKKKKKAFQEVKPPACHNDQWRPQSIKSGN